MPGGVVTLSVVGGSLRELEMSLRLSEGRMSLHLWISNYCLLANRRTLPLISSTFQLPINEDFSG